MKTINSHFAASALAVLLGASLLCINAVAQSQSPTAATPPKPNGPVISTTIDPNKVKLPPQPEIDLDLYIFNVTSEIDLRKNGGVWGGCAWNGPNAKPAKIKLENTMVDAKLCRFAAPKGSKITVAARPANYTLYQLCENSVTGPTGTCYNKSEFVLQTKGFIAATQTFKP